MFRPIQLHLYFPYLQTAYPNPRFKNSVKNKAIRYSPATYLLTFFWLILDISGLLRP